MVYFREEKFFLSSAIDFPSTVTRLDSKTLLQAKRKASDIAQIVIFMPGFNRNSSLACAFLRAHYFIAQREKPTSR